MRAGTGSGQAITKVWSLVNDPISGNVIVGGGFRANAMTFSPITMQNSQQNSFMYDGYAVQIRTNGPDPETGMGPALWAVTIGGGGSQVVNKLFMDSDGFLYLMVSNEQQGTLQAGLWTNGATASLSTSTSPYSMLLKYTAPIPDASVTPRLIWCNLFIQDGLSGLYTDAFSPAMVVDTLSGMVYFAGGRMSPRGSLSTGIRTVTAAATVTAPFGDDLLPSTANDIFLIRFNSTSGLPVWNVGFTGTGDDNIFGLWQNPTNGNILLLASSSSLTFRYPTRASFMWGGSTLSLSAGGKFDMALIAINDVCSRPNPCFNGGTCVNLPGSTSNLFLCQVCIQCNRIVARV